MFQNSYQSGTYFDLFDPKTPPDKTKNLYKIVQHQTNNNPSKIFDKPLKTYIFDFISPFSKIIFPKEDRKDLHLIQRYLVLQIYLQQIKTWHLELTVSDIHKTRRRIILTNSIKKIEKKPFFIKYPLGTINQCIWTNFVVDLHSFMDAFKDQTYRSLDSFQITGMFKLKRIFTTQHSLSEYPDHEESSIDPVNLLPKNYYYPEQLSQQLHIIKYDSQLVIAETEHEQKSQKRVGSRQRKQSMSISKKNKEKKTTKYQKKFLTNQKGDRMKNETDSDSIGNSKKFQSISNYERNKKKVNGSLPPTKNTRSKNKKVNSDSKKNKNNHQAMVNPWRTRQHQTDYDKSSPKSKNLNDSEIKSAKTTMFQTKNKLANKVPPNKGFDVKSDNYSDSDYAEFSQKFSTLSDGKFFKNTFVSQTIQDKNEDAHEDPEEIEENIELESNEMVESLKVQNDQIINKPVYQQMNKQINKQIEDKEITPETKKQKEEFGNISYYGFGEKIMNKVIGEIQRPYSPPIGQRQATEQVSENNDRGEKEMELIYDPILNCYYDHKTHTYYEMKQ